MFIKMKIICITPIKNIFGVFERLESMSDNLYYEPDIDKDALKTLLKVSGADYIFTNPNKQNYMLDGDLLQFGQLKAICTASTGTNHIDVKYCEEKEIEIISITKDYQVINAITSTAEHTLALMLSLIRKIPTSFHSVRDGNWDWEPYVGRQMNSLTIGIIGYGRLGKLMAKYCDALGMEVLLHDPYVFSFGGNIERNKQPVELDELLERSDVISLHVHVTDETREMINKNTISKMVKRPYLINTSRGEIVNEDDIIDALRSEDLQGYATDVIRDEFGDIKNSKLVDESITPQNKIIITPHIAGMTKEAQEIAYHWAIDKLEKKHHD
jgi:D-3-phosphoglycerate dehydrogenase